MKPEFRDSHSLALGAPFYDYRQENLNVTRHLPWCTSQNFSACSSSVSERPQFSHDFDRKPVAHHDITRGSKDAAPRTLCLVRLNNI